MVHRMKDLLLSKQVLIFKGVESHSVKYVWFSEDKVSELQKLYVNSELIWGRFPAKNERKNLKLWKYLTSFPNKISDFFNSETIISIKEEPYSWEN